ncbi:MULTISPECIES: LysR family transcriptional regulator [Agrobacterium]|uniref:DNA-binding transcriptional LysR family regulator n=2 Tax=Agrobacterium larrymoorei TaxID=160699 RepID=A0AAJ2B408_9HYPH|nr:LysR family transcriptional regulator [Agrobacterium larrymoorei]MDQ1194476.1 DNA-binding transcriptional LysR family regulator [Rhizobium sp. SORGH_AS_0787]MDR6099898.1 DNA-binding transcriptional LysR family regulator [Agrobacterium larrymoorei]
MIDPGKSDLSLRLLEIFDAIMRCGTTVEAAEQLGISQPAVSNGIRQLETQTGVTLFERLHRRLQPTEEAVALHEDIKPVFSLLRGFASRAQDMRQGVSGRLRVISTPPLGHTVAPLAMRRFLKERKDVSIAYDVRRLEHVVDAVQSGNADIGLALALERHPAVNVEVLARTHMVAVVPRTEETTDTVVNAETLAKHDFVGLEVDSTLGRLVRAAFERDGVAYKPRVEVRYCSTAAVLARAGIGSAVIDPYTAAFNAGLGLVECDFLPPIELAAVLITRKGVPRSRLQHAFISEMRKALTDFAVGGMPAIFGTR